MSKHKTATTEAQTLCAVCKANPVGADSYVCSDDVALVVTRLRAVPDLIVQLGVTISRTDAVSNTSGRRSAETGLPYNLAASEALADLRTALAKNFVTVSGKAIPYGAQRSDIQGAWLSQQATWLKSDAEAPAVIGHLSTAISAALRAIDKHDEKQYLGTCGAQYENETTCPAELWGRSSNAEATCKVCGAVWDAKDRKAYLNEQVRGSLAPLDDIYAALPKLSDTRLKFGQLQGLLKKHGIPSSAGKGDQKLYPVGQVLDLVKAVKAS